MSDTWRKTATKGFQLTENPPEPERQLRTYYEYKSIHLHSISSFSEDLNDEFLILLLPPPHDHLRVRVNDRPNIVLDILLLSAFIMEGHSAGGQSLENISYVDLWATCHTYMNIWYMKFDELVHGLKNSFARCWNSIDVGTLIKGIYY